LTFLEENQAQNQKCLYNLSFYLFIFVTKLLKLILSKKNEVTMRLILTIIIILYTSLLRAQPELDIKPDQIVFEDLFNRIDFAYLINKGNAVLSVDSISYNQSNYIIDFEGNQQLPFTILPNDSVKMNVTLSGFYYITHSDTSDTMYIFNNGIKNPERLRIKIDFFEDDFGFVAGTVRDGATPLDSTTLYFFYNGIYLYDKATTNSQGNYLIELPEGDYTIAAERQGYYVMFYDSTYDPFFAKLLEVDDDDTVIVNFNMKKINDFTKSISGQVYDSTQGNLVNKGIVIVRTGTHVPIPLLKENPLVPDLVNAVAGFIQQDGSFTIYTEYENHYYLQAHTDYFLPGYYNDEGLASVFWQNADSILIDGNITGKDISLLRDSSYGNGSIGGTINFATFYDETNFEGITLLARNINTNALYSYNFGKQEAVYNIFNIPYGTYEIVAQKIGYDNALSQIVTIDPGNFQITEINVTFSPTSVDEQAALPDNFILYQNYPNPFNPVTNISFYLPQEADVKLSVINILGETIATLLNNKLSYGNYSVRFDGSNLASGMYIILFEANQTRLNKKMILLK